MDLSATVLFDDQTTTILDPEGNVIEQPATQADIPMFLMNPAQFPADLSMDLVVLGWNGSVRTQDDGAVAGFADAYPDPFMTHPLQAKTHIVAPDQLSDVAPLAIMMPFSLWQVTLVPEMIQGSTAIQPVLAPYQVLVESGWNGLTSPSTLTLADAALPVVVSSSTPYSQTAFIPVTSGRTDPVVGKDMLSGQAFTIAGPGTYKVHGHTLVKQP